MAELVAASIAVSAGLFITILLFTRIDESVPDERDGIRLVYLTGAGWYHHYNNHTSTVVDGPYRSKKTAYKAAIHNRNGDIQ